MRYLLIQKQLLIDKRVDICYLSHVIDLSSDSSAVYYGVITPARSLMSVCIWMNIQIHNSSLEHELCSIRPTLGDIERVALTRDSIFR